MSLNNVLSAMLLFVGCCVFAGADMTAGDMKQLVWKHVAAVLLDHLCPALKSCLRCVFAGADDWWQHEAAGVEAHGSQRWHCLHT
jgi:hypothetical protein